MGPVPVPTPHSWSPLMTIKIENRTASREMTGGMMAIIMISLSSEMKIVCYR
jgi:hypothetical protein